MNKDTRIVLTGFMGVGKSSVARQIARLLRVRNVDLDIFLAKSVGRAASEIIDDEGEAEFRRLETEALRDIILDPGISVLSLGGGTWTLERNREIIKNTDFTSVWLEATFKHCWLNIAFSHKNRPLAKDKKAARALFNQRQADYCLADWHFIIKPGYTSFDVAKQIVDEVFS